MSRLEEIREEIARQLGFKDYEDARYDLDERFIFEVAKKYAKECVVDSLHKASYNARMKAKDNIEDLSMLDDWNELDKDSITNENNIILL